MCKREEKPKISLVVTDLDNTLWDWFRAWHASFAPMLDTLSRLSGVSRERLISEIREVHRKRETTEYSYLLNEIPSLTELHPTEEPLKIYDEAMYVLNRERLKNTSLYWGVSNALREFQRRGIPVVAYTESGAYWSEWRIKKTGLDGLIGAMYSSPDHELPNGITVSDLRRRPPSAYGLSGTIHKNVPAGIRKPDPQVLQSIISDFSALPNETVYVGDSLMKDVAMAQDLGVHDVHAEYGTVHHKEEYDLLRCVSHWSDEDIERERRLSTLREVTPAYSLEESFSELFSMFDFCEA